MLHINGHMASQRFVIFPLSRRICFSQLILIAEKKHCHQAALDHQLHRPDLHHIFWFCLVYHREGYYIRALISHSETFHQNKVQVSYFEMTIVLLPWSYRRVWCSFLAKHWAVDFFFFSFSLRSWLIRTISCTLVKHTTPKALNVTWFQFEFNSGVNITFTFHCDPIYTTILFITVHLQAWL